MPVVVGVGRFTQRKTATVEEALDPLELMAEASRRAAEDSGAADAAALLASLDAVATVNMQIEMRVNPGSFYGDTNGKALYTNPARTLARLLSAPNVHTELLSSGHSGNSPQYLVSDACERIASGKVKAALLSGCEDLATFSRALKEGYGIAGLGELSVVNATGEKTQSSEDGKVLDWGDDPGGVPEEVGGSFEDQVISSQE